MQVWGAPKPLEGKLRHGETYAQGPQGFRLLGGLDLVLQQPQSDGGPGEGEEACHTLDVLVPLTTAHPGQRLSPRSLGLPRRVPSCPGSLVLLHQKALWLHPEVLLATCIAASPTSAAEPGRGPPRPLFDPPQSKSGTGPPPQLMLHFRTLPHQQ